MASTVRPDDITHPTAPKTIAVDFDGVLAKYDRWRGHEHHGDPMPGAKEWLIGLLDEGFHVIIFTTRGTNDVYNWLERHGFPLPKPDVNLSYDTEVGRALLPRIRNHLYINDYPHVKGRNPHKPPYFLLIDDRATTFKGSFDEFTPEKLRAFRAHWEGQE